MSIPKIVLFYVFTPLPDPEAIRLWQHTLADSLHLRGRVIVSAQGINATLGGDLPDVKKYVRAMREYTPFKAADVKWSDGVGDDFPRLSVKVRDELVTFGHPAEVVVDESGVVGGGVHLSPAQVDELVADRGLASQGGEVVFFDGRNEMEAAIGRFADAVVPETEATRDFVAELESGKYDELKDKPVITYCTGGIRCEVLSVLMKNRGFQEVYQIDGGIVRYGEARGTDGLWDGSLYVFDKRMHQEFGPNAQSLGTCVECGKPTADYVNCVDQSCRRQFLRCGACTAAGAHPSCGHCAPAAL